LGNLFSVKQACEHAGLRALITASRQEIVAADGVILPGVGAFGDAMETLARLDLVSVLRDIAASSKPLLGICLGMQLLMTESHEFGRHRGLGIIQGEVVRLEVAVDGLRMLKVPQVGWNRIYAVGLGDQRDGPGPNGTLWKSQLLEGLADGEYQYFVHSFYPIPVDASVVVSTTRYGPTDFCSSFRLGSVFACQFHPERSGPAGLRIYRNLAELMTTNKR
jgi:glutamine amidotransferase